MERKAFSPKEVAEILGVSKHSVYRMIKRGVLRAVTLNRHAGSSYRIPKDALDEFLRGEGGVTSGREDSSRVSG